MDNYMKTKLLALALLAGGSMFAQTRFSIGIGVGGYQPAYQPGYLSAPAYAYYQPPCPGPDYDWVDGYWFGNGPRHRWIAGYWVRQPYRGVYYSGPYARPGYARGFYQDRYRGFVGDRYRGGYRDRGRGYGNGFRGR